MKHRLIGGVVCLACVFCVAGAVPARTSHHVPWFTDYAVSQIYKGKLAPLQPVYRNAASKTNIQLAAEHRPDFAGHYKMAIGSCGTGCIGISVIDSQTGSVFFLNQVLTHDSENTLPAVQYRVNSKLLVLRGIRNEDARDYGVHYYEFENGRFVYLRSVFYHRKFHW